MELTYLTFFLHTAYADDTTFFLKDLESVKNVLEMLNQFYMVSRLRPNSVNVK